MARRVICKVQRSLDGEDRALIYSEDHAVFFEGPMEEHLRAFMGDAFKVFVVGYVDARDGKFVIEGCAPWQAW